MPADLDELFATLGRHADAIPLVPAAQARQRGRQRDRNRATVSAVVAVCLIAACVGFIVRHDRLPGPVATHRPLPAVGAPIELGGQARVNTATGADGRLYTAWQLTDGTIKVNAVDLHTGAVAWPAVVVGSRADSIGLLHALPKALILSVGHSDDTGSTMYVYDPATGRQRWQLSFAAEDDLAVHQSALVRMSAETGLTAAFEWATGAKRWTLPAQADPPVETVGNWSPVTAELAFPSERTVGLADDRLIQVTRAGKVQVRDIDTGALRLTTTSVAPDRDPRTFFGYDGRLFNDEHACCGGTGYRIRMTELSAEQGSSTVLRSEGPGHQLNAMLPCARQRLCVIDQDREGRTTLAAIDLTSRLELWRVAAPNGALSLTTLDGYTLVSGDDGDKVVYDQDGKQVFSTTAGRVDWLGRNTLLLLPASVAGPVSTVTIPDGRVTTLGEMPPPSDQCSWSTDRLACPADTSLQVWSLSG